VTGWERVLFSGISLALCYIALSWPFKFGSFASLFVWIGNISYAVYLLHPIAGDLCAILNFKILHSNPLLISCVLGVPLTLICATLSWIYLEKPLMRLGRRLAEKVLPVRAQD
jgi:peptidoglycan/LPS O-acetylase OafA/YrhL